MPFNNFVIPGRLKYLTGDATVPEAAGTRYIIHVNNSLGAWGAGFVLAVSKRWKKPEEEYRRWYRSQTNFKLGEIQIIQVQSDTAVVNMIAQDGFPTQEKPIAADLNALAVCLDKIGTHVKKEGGSIHCPRICCGIGGAQWEDVEPLLIEHLIRKGINVNVYNLPVENEPDKAAEVKLFNALDKEEK